MATSEERLKILKMVDDGKISAEEAGRLLAALSKTKKETRRPSSEGGSRWLRVRVTDLEVDKTTVNVNLPLSLVNVRLRLGARFVPEVEDVDMMDELSKALNQGLTGKVMDVVDEEEGQRVEIYVE